MDSLKQFAEKDDKYFYRKDKYVNPSASDETLLEYSRQFNALTENNFGEVYRDKNGVETDLTPITRADILAIINKNAL